MIPRQRAFKHANFCNQGSALGVADLDDELQAAFAIQLDGKVHVYLAQGHAVVIAFGGYKVKNATLQPVLMGSVNGTALESDQ